ncbi:MAG: hypothetical protein AB7T49_20475 [Oligoflexales bacterium]
MLLRILNSTLVVLLAIVSCKKASYEIVKKNNTIKNVGADDWRIEVPSQGEVNVPVPVAAFDCGEGNQGIVDWMVIEIQERKQGTSLFYTFPFARTYIVEATCEFFPNRPLRKTILITEPLNPGQSGNQNQNKK